jgi:delta 1-pyrroline-5-carboxylate dehydrogenase
MFAITIQKVQALASSRKFISCSSSLAVRKMHLLMKNTLVNGEWITSHNGSTFDVINPANEEVVGSVPDMNVDDTQKAIDSAHKAFYDPSWQNSTAKERSTLLKVSTFFMSALVFLIDFSFFPEMVSTVGNQPTRDRKHHDG